MRQLLAFLFVFLTCGLVFAAGPDAGPLRTLFDKTKLSDGWTRQDKAEFFSKDTLFDLCDGEAEAYFPYGFRGAVAATYIKDGDKTKSAGVEVYEMGSLLDAYGVYSSNREADSHRIDVGADGFGGSTQIMFYVDRYFVKARVDAENLAGELLSIAKAVARELPADTKKPSQLALVAIPGVVPQSDQYVGQSVLGYACLPKGFLVQVKTEGVLARGFVVLTASPDEAAKSLEKYLRQAGAANAKKRQDVGNDVFVVADPMHKGVAISQAGRYLIGAAGLENPETQGLPIVRQLRKQTESAK